MKALIQRVKTSQVLVDEIVIGSIDRGLLVFLGVGQNDSKSDADYLVEKISNLRIFEDSNGKMNESLINLGFEMLVVSQFTLFGECKKGRRPSFTDAAPPEKANELYEYFVEKVRNLGIKVETGKFRAMMEVSLINDGPVTFMVESK
ncbi:MAG: D-tyrosyl-tRNA(Tyr) deacylase [Desulfobacterales bacterium]|nr:D-tyrosyl-tRNA(Tyr) deacylase [Desulfobacterales bacterium]